MTDGSDFCTGSTDGERLTKREYFAAMALQGMLANTSELLTEIHNEGITKATLAVVFADSLIDALNERRLGQ